MPQTPTMRPRRFESGSLEQLVSRTLALAGLPEVTFHGSRNGSKPFRVGQKKYTQVELLAFIDELRLRMKLEPIRRTGTTVRKSTANRGNFGLNPLTR